MKFCKSVVLPICVFAFTSGISYSGTPDLASCDSWVPACTSNYTGSSRPSSYPISYVVIHKVQGTASSAASWFQNCSAGVTAHYIFDNSSGYCYQSVREANIAWHAANWTYNSQSVGIEHGGYVTNNDTATVCYGESALETKSCISYYGAPYNRTHILGHSEVPGADHTDPGVYWNWTYYMSMCNPNGSSSGGGGGGSTATGAGMSPDVVSWGEGRIDAVKVGNNNNIFYRSMVNGAWSGWTNLGLFCNGNPSICSWGVGRLDVFCRGFDNNLWHNASFNGTWYGWENLGDTLSDSPDCVSRGPGKIDVVFRGANGNVWHRWMDNYAWVGYNNLGANANSAPTVCAMPSGRLDVFFRGYDNGLWHNAGPGNNTWWGWENLGDTLSSGPGAVSRGNGRIDVAFRGSNGNIWHRWMTGYAWVGYNNQGLNANSSPTICAMPSGRLDMFFNGYDNGMWHDAGPGNNTWWGWENLGHP